MFDSPRLSNNLIFQFSQRAPWIFANCAWWFHSRNTGRGGSYPIYQSIVFYSTYSIVAMNKATWHMEVSWNGGTPKSSILIGLWLKFSNFQTWLVCQTKYDQFWGSIGCYHVWAALYRHLNPKKQPSKLLQPTVIDPQIFKTDQTRKYLRLPICLYA